MGYTVIDFETTGLNYTQEQVIEVSALKLNEDLQEIGTFNTFVALEEGKELPQIITDLTSITPLDLKYGMHEEIALELLMDFIGTDTVVAQYAPFDLAFLAHKTGFEPKRFICTKSLTSIAEPNENSSLVPTCERLGIKLEGAHRAINDCIATAEVLRKRMDDTRIPSEHYFNTLCITEGRALNFIPKFTRYMLLKNGGKLADFTETKGKGWF
jgi:DNA polymerase III epsilon subunit-like protein